MKLDFAKDTKRNIVSSAINSGLKLVFPFLNRTLFLWLLGPEFLGLNSLFTSVLGVLMLAEFGFGKAVNASMYKPIAEDDRELVCAYLRFYRHIYRCVGTVILLAGLCLMPWLRKLIHGTIPPGIDLNILYLVHLANTSASYFFFSYRGSILSAHNRADVLNNISTFTEIIKYISVFLVLLLTRNYYYYVVTTVAFTIIGNLLIFKESHRLFADIEPRGELPADLKRKLKSGVSSIVFHKIGGIIVTYADNIVISAFLGLTAVAAYGNYYYVVASVSGLVSVVYTSVRAGFGNKIHTAPKEEVFALFLRTCRLMQVTIIWCAAMMIALYQPFIAVWTKGNPMLLRHSLTPFLMVLFFYVNQSRQVLLTFKAAGNLWRQDRWKPIVSGMFNLALNIGLVLSLPQECKLDGVILSTIVSYVFIEIPWETRVVFNNFFSCALQKQYLRQHLEFALHAPVLCALAWLALRFVPLEGIAGFLVKGVLAAAVSSTWIAVFFHGDVTPFLRRPISPGTD